MLQGVTATLFKKGADNAYAICEKHVTGKDISPVTTGTDGAYSFNNLAAGDYIVAFSGPILKKFTDATSYQKNGQNDANTNDGKAVPKAGKVRLTPMLMPTISTSPAMGRKYSCTALQKWGPSL